MGLRSVYDSEVANKLGAWLSVRSRANLDALVGLLRCPFIGAGAPSSFEFELTPGEDAVKNAWSTMLRYHDETTNLAFDAERYMICGLLQNDRWRGLFTDAKTARRFAELVAIYFWNDKPDAGIKELCANDVHYMIWTQLQIAMSHWIPQRAADEIFTLRAFASALFGEAWCCFVYDTRDADVTLSTLLDLHRPDFLPGRLTVDHVQYTALLPDLT